MHDPDLATPSQELRPGSYEYAAAPVLLEGEDAAAYQVLLERVATALGPADVLEEVWVRDVVELVWEVLRLRRLKARLVAAAACEGMAEVLKPLMPEHEACSLARSWAARREPAMEKVKAALAGAELSMDHVTARTLSVRMAEFERFDRMITAAEARRASALRELDHHREYFSQRLRRALKPIEDSEIGGVPAHFMGEGST